MVEPDQQVTAANHHCCPAVCTIVVHEHRAVVAAGVELMIAQHTVSLNGTGSNPLPVPRQADEIYC